MPPVTDIYEVKCRKLQRHAGLVAMVPFGAAKVGDVWRVHLPARSTKGTTARTGDTDACSIPWGLLAS